MPHFEFNGTEDDKRRLLESISRNCSCPPRPFGQAINPGEVCAPHRMLLEKGRVDHLLFERAIKSRLLKEEFGVTPKDTKRR